MTLQGSLLSLFVIMNYMSPGHLPLGLWYWIPTRTVFYTVTTTNVTSVPSRRGNTDCVSLLCQQHTLVRFSDEKLDCISPSSCIYRPRPLPLNLTSPRASLDSSGGGSTESQYLSKSTNNQINIYFSKSRTQ